MWWNTDFDFFEVRLHVVLCPCYVSVIRVYEELSLADNLINERSIYSSTRQEIRDCRNCLYQPVGETRFVNPTRVPPGGRNLKGRREAAAMEVEGLSRCDATSALKPKRISGIRCIPQETRITHIRRKGRRKEGNRKKF